MALLLIMAVQVWGQMLQVLMRSAVAESFDRLSLQGKLPQPPEPGSRAVTCSAITTLPRGCLSTVLSSPVPSMWGILTSLLMTDEMSRASLY